MISQMVTIQRKLKINKFIPMEYPVYHQDEADELGLEYTHWKDTEPGEYGVSDDGYVSLCI